MTTSATRHPVRAAAEAGPRETDLRVRGLTVAFPAVSETPVVDGVSFDVPRGRVVALVGQSGSGKSVTARSLIGLAGDGARVAVEALRIGGDDLTRADEARWRAIRGTRVGFVLQDALTSLDPLRTVGREVGEALREGSRAVRAERTREAIVEAGIPDPDERAAQYPHQLSGGLRQRALIASAIVGDPPFVIADEPTTALDVTVQQRILDLLRGLADSGRGVLLITHDLAVVAQLADHVHVMHRGRIIESGTAREILRTPKEEYTRRLLQAIPSSRTRGERLLPPEPGAPATDAARSGGQDAVRTPRAGSEPLLRVSGASVSFPAPRRGRRVALDGVGLELRPGETLGIVGESGSGKSTLGRAVLGLQRLDAGRIDLFGEEWSALPERRRRPHRRRIQTISQDPLGTFDPRLPVARLLDQPLRLWTTLGREERRRESRRLLALVGLDAAVLDQRPQRLSGGQRQRVAIAQALASGPELLIADEPVSALDVLTQAQVLDLLVDLRERTGLAMLFISHDLGVVHHLSDRIAVMTEGVVVETGPVDDVFLRPQHPYTQRLLEAVPTLEGIR
ncbi:ABC transporter ATP-binding protein [Microbacterium betulae]|uniref:ABC transporter ATP-binding protein n=1 Tax=Microbacterium betulae TaxID=2981139 RepID=A0AA97FI07_9MICO|nr:ABC transporter ATP-binding protein [Microbacterium sp. AB]WOF23043.1 ABC transporter ATP-binding protein [Microbacterium sp. AB]